MNFKKLFFKYTIVLIGLTLANSSFGQDKESNNPYAGLPFKDRIYLGGDLGLNFGDVTYIRLAPILGYKINPQFSIGAGPSYQYYKDNRYSGYQTSIYGGSVFGRYFIIENIFLQTELEVLNLESIHYNPVTDFVRERVTIPIWFVGAGFSQRTANGSGFFLGIFYDVIGDINSPYPNDFVFRAGGMIAL